MLSTIFIHLKNSLIYQCKKKRKASKHGRSAAEMGVFGLNMRWSPKTDYGVQCPIQWFSVKKWIEIRARQKTQRTAEDGLGRSIQASGRKREGMRPSRQCPVGPYSKARQLGGQVPSLPACCLTWQQVKSKIKGSPSTSTDSGWLLVFFIYPIKF